MRNLWIIGGAIAAVWAIAFFVAKLAESAKATPESILTELQSKPIADLSGPTRNAQIVRLADQLNQLEFEDRRKLQRNPEFRAFFESMTADEQSDFLERTLPEGFRQMMRALNEMTPERRKRIVDRALADLAEAEAEGGPPPTRPENEQHAEKIISEGMSAFYEEANADVKLDFAPVLEQIQRSLQGRRQ